MITKNNGSPTVYCTLTYSTGHSNPARIILGPRTGIHRPLRTGVPQPSSITPNIHSTSLLCISSLLALTTTMTNAPKTLRLKPDGFVTIQSALTAASKELGAPATLALADAEGVFLECEAGPFDPLHPTRGVRREDIMWFASTTKLLTSICELPQRQLTSGYLQLVDAGKLTLETDMRGVFPPLDVAASQIITGFDESGRPVMERNEAPVTLGQMLNQTSGFGMEFGDKVSRWKKVAEKGTGFVNSCKVVRSSSFSPSLCPTSPPSDLGIADQLAPPRHSTPPRADARITSSTHLSASPQAPTGAMATAPSGSASSSPPSWARARRSTSRPTSSARSAWPTRRSTRTAPSGPIGCFPSASGPTAGSRSSRTSCPSSPCRASASLSCHS